MNDSILYVVRDVYALVDTFVSLLACMCEILFVGELLSLRTITVSVVSTSNYMVCVVSSTMYSVYGYNLTQIKLSYTKYIVRTHSDKIRHSYETDL